MGGPGSGTWWRWNKKTYAEEVNRIDIRYMKKQNLLRAGSSGSLSWSCNGEPTGNISYSMFHDHMILNYRHRQNGEDWQDIKDTIRLDETDCNYGGTRKWFICPSCGDRVALLYGPGIYFRCRTCSGMSYASQSEGYLDRQVRKARKIRKRLAVDSEWWDADCLSDPIFMKPKGMRWKTYERLKQTENQAQDEIERVFVSRYGHGWY